MANAFSVLKGHLRLLVLLSLPAAVTMFVQAIGMVVAALASLSEPDGYLFAHAVAIIQSMGALYAVACPVAGFQQVKNAYEETYWDAECDREALCDWYRKGPGDTRLIGSKLVASILAVAAIPLTYALIQAGILSLIWPGWRDIDVVTDRIPIWLSFVLVGGAIWGLCVVWALKYSEHVEKRRAREQEAANGTPVPPAFADRRRS